ncbi:hypothetical protein BY996DRAFT_8395195 [Phakopsora pachyrhizi]|nr:hypothetical protein BY996DRAFT_8395195 [Phakopsora pachyrhizi]
MFFMVRTKNWLEISDGKIILHLFKVVVLLAWLNSATNYWHQTNTEMHNSSLSSASSSTYSWDFDPDLIIPDGPLTLLQSDSKNKTEDSSIQSALIILANQVSHLVNRVKSSKTIVRPRTDDSEHDLHQLGCFESEDEDEKQGEETGRGGTLRLKIIKPQQVQLFDCFKEPCLQQQLPHQKSNRMPIKDTNLSLLISSSSCQEINNSLDSISSHSSSELQSTIKASITPTPTLTSTVSSSTHESSPSQPPPDQLFNLPFHSASSSSSSVLNPAIFTVLASGAKGTVTRLQPNKRCRTQYPLRV